MTVKRALNSTSASKNITKRIQELGDWRGVTLARVRQLIHDGDPEIQEEWKWVKDTSPGTPVWSHDGGVCTGESYKQVVKLTFFRGASSRTPRSCSTPVSRGACAEPSTFAKARSSTRPLSSN
jgi:hypothetical protein